MPLHRILTVDLLRYYHLVPLLHVINHFATPEYHHLYRTSTIVCIIIIIVPHTIHLL
jgi:hypothetical protein